MIPSPLAPDHKQTSETTSFNNSSEHELIMMPKGNGNENKLKFSDIMKATNNFYKEHIIECGGYGLVYKAELPDGCRLARHQEAQR